MSLHIEHDRSTPPSLSTAMTIQSAEPGRCFVLSCNQFARRCDYPADYQTAFGDDPETVMSRGGSSIIGPLGQVLAGPDFSGEAILIADVDLAEIARARLDFDAVGRYARPDVFRLVVDETSRTPVAFKNAAPPLAISEE
jgi:nitrilase